METDPKKIAVSVILLGLVALAGFQAWRAQRSMASPYQAPTPTPTENTIASASASPSSTATAVRTPLFTHSTRTPSPQPTTVQSDAGVILDGLNHERAALGRIPLQPQATLQALARAHAIDMVAQGYFDHTSPDGITFEDRIRASGYPLGVSGENLGLTTGEPASVIASWMASPQHRANILDERFAAVGIALAQGTWQGIPATFVVAVFGSVR